MCVWESDSVKGQCRGLTGTVLCVSVYWNVYSLDVHVPCVCDWQSSLYFADVYSYREATWHIVNYTRNLSQFFLFRSARFFMWSWLVIFSWEPRVWECVCVSPCIWLFVHVCLSVWFKRRLLVYATVGSPHCVSARVGLADCDWRREPLRPGKGLCSPTVDPLNGTYLFICSYLTRFV